MNDLGISTKKSIKKDVLLKDYTTYKVGGSPKYGVVSPVNIDELITILKHVRKNGIKYKILGNGSNVIFNDKGYDGLIIKLDEWNDIQIFGREITVGAGYSLMRLAMKASLSNLTGLEFATGIPGTVGGAVFMNAGAYLSDMGYVIKSIKVLTPDYNIIEIDNKDLNFHYRTSFLKLNPDYVCLEAHIVLKYGKKEEIMKLIADRKARRVETQPLEYPSAGSVFRNPPGDSAGRIIESLGLKGMKIGGAMVSEKHANFIINTGSATGEEIKELINKVRDIVKEKTGIELILEQEFVE